MVAPKIRIKRPAAAIAAVPVEQVAVEQEPEPELFDVETAVVAAASDSLYDEMSIGALRAEAESRGLDNTGRRSVIIELLEAYDAKPVAPKLVVVTPKVTLKPVATPKPVAVPKPVSVAPKVAPTPIPQKAEEPLRGDDAAVSVASMTMKELFDILKTGQTLFLAKETGNVMSLSLAGTSVDTRTATRATVAPKRTLRGDAYWKEILSPEYYSWYYEDGGTGTPWGEMTAEDKEAFVNESNVTYEPHDDPRVNSLHQVTALLTHLKIEKYKPEYKTSAARDALKA